MSSTAYLVAVFRWTDKPPYIEARGVGIFSEQSPTLGLKNVTTVLMDAEGENYSEAVDRLIRWAAQSYLIPEEIVRKATDRRGPQP